MSFRNMAETVIVYFYTELSKNRVKIHVPGQNRVNVHNSKGQSCKNTRLASGGEKKKPATGSSFRKSLMAGNPLFLGTFEQKEGR